MASRNNTTPLNGSCDGETVTKLQRDLARKYQNVGSRVIDMWRNFTPKQRETTMRESVGDGKVLKHSRDPSLGNIFQFISEWNLRDITTDPDHFLDMFEFRATTDLSNQVIQCDTPHTKYMMEHYGLRYRAPGEWRNEFMFFISGEKYGVPM